MSDPEHECPTEGHGGECAGPLAGNGHLPCPTCCDATRSARTDEYDVWMAVVAPDRNSEQNQAQASAKRTASTSTSASAGLEAER